MFIRKYNVNGDDITRVSFIIEPAANDNGQETKIGADILENVLRVYAKAAIETPGIDTQNYVSVLGQFTEFLVTGETVIAVLQISNIRGNHININSIVHVNVSEFGEEVIQEMIDTRAIVHILGCLRVGHLSSVLGRFMYIEPGYLKALTGIKKLSVNSINDNYTFITATDRVRLSGTITKLTGDNRVKRFTLQLDSDSNSYVNCHYSQLADADDFSNNIRVGNHVSVCGRITAFKDSRLEHTKDYFIYQLQAHKVYNLDEVE